MCSADPQNSSQTRLSPVDVTCCYKRLPAQRARVRIEYDSGSRRGLEPNGASVNSHAASSIDCIIVAGQSSNSEPKSSNRVWLPRLEINTARRIDLRRAVSRLAPASYAYPPAQLSQFKQTTLFRMREWPIARTYCRIGSCGVQIQSPLRRRIAGPI